MAGEITPLKLRALPVQLVEAGNDSIIIKRGCVEINILGEGAADVVQDVLAATSDVGATRNQICELFAGPDRLAIENLIQKLESRGILVPVDDIERLEESAETNLEVFYWHFGEHVEQVRSRLSERRIVIAGINHISKQLSFSLAASGAENVEIVDYPPLRNLRLFDNTGELISDQWPASGRPPLQYGEWKDRFDPRTTDCIVATSDFGGLHLMREWNRFCVSRKLLFLPVVLQDLVGYVGPLVVPGETACFECLRARQNAQMDNAEARRASEYYAFEGQAVAGFHPAMATVLGDIAAIELTKFYGIRMPLWRVGTLIEVNLLATRLDARKVLKIPRCPVCSTLNTRSSVGVGTGSFKLNPAESQ